MQGTNRGFFSKLNNSCKSKQNKNPWWAVRNPPPVKGANTLSSVTPMTQRWWMHFPLCPWGWRQGVAPATALHISGTWRGNPPFVIVTVAVAVTIAIAVAVSIALAVSIANAVDVAIAYRHCHCCRPLLLQSPLPITASVSFVLSSAIAVAVALAVGHCRLHHRWQLRLSSPLSITVAVAVAHCQELLPWHGKNSIQTI
jgi:hypothetical protein